MRGYSRTKTGYLAFDGITVDMPIDRPDLCRFEIEVKYLDEYCPGDYWTPDSYDISIESFSVESVSVYTDPDEQKDSVEVDDTHPAWRSVKRWLERRESDSTLRSEFENQLNLML